MNENRATEAKKPCDVIGKEEKKREDPDRRNYCKMRREDTVYEKWTGYDRFDEVKRGSGVEDKARTKLK